MSYGMNSDFMFILYLATFEKMLTDKKVDADTKTEIRNLMPLVSQFFIHYVTDIEVGNWYVSVFVGLK